ncbi:MAG: CapA family protein, partial [Chloroflexota bacterium]
NTFRRSQPLLYTTSYDYFMNKTRFEPKPISLPLLLTTLFIMLAGCTSWPFPLIEAPDTDTASDEVAYQARTLAGGPAPPVAYFSTVTPTPVVTPTPEVLTGPITVHINSSIPKNFSLPISLNLSNVTAVDSVSGPLPLYVVDKEEEAGVQIDITQLQAKGDFLLERYFVVVAPFDTVNDDISFAELQARWQNGSTSQGPLYVTEGAASLLSPIFGQRIAPIASPDAMTIALETIPGTYGILSFDQLDPSFKVLTVDGVNVLDNRLNKEAYKLGVGIRVIGSGSSLVAPILQSQIQPYTNRDPSELTTLLMTGVTAMSRNTAARMDEHGVLYPAQVISNTLRAADITHISNEVPFLDDCETNASLNNLVLCSHTDYWRALEALGTDIVGLSGNHVNDFGRLGAKRSLAFYHINNIPIYGSGLNTTEACKPLRWEHNGNTFAFIATLAFEPQFAWATDTQPGACYYYHNQEMILDMVRSLSEEVDVVSIELQYYETYNPYPTGSQVIEFRELRDAGADIVTGVQSHVPQSMEPYGELDEGGPGMILYGLGNFFFDQMWSWETRTELMARHTIYEGQLLNTEILTAVLEDFAQPRWTTAEERVALLQRIFDAAPAR